MSTDRYSVVTDLARFRGKSTSTPFITARSARVSTFAFIRQGRLTVRKQLQGNDIDQTLETIDGLRHSERLEFLADRVVVLVADDDFMSAKSHGCRLTWSTLSCGDLGESRLNLGIERILGHDEDDPAA